MNSHQAKKLSLPDIMSRLGYEPVRIKKGGYQYWYLSPFRSEKEPSFVTSYLGGKWIWNDFADTGGTVIDFIMRHESLTSVKDALTFLGNMYQGHLFDRHQSQSRGVKKMQAQTAPDLFSFKQQGREAAPRAQNERELEFLDAYRISNPVIHHYLEQKRAIPARIADIYLKEVKYRNTKSGKDYFAFGMENESGGYEIRAASDSYSFKSALIKRDISLIPGSSPERGIVNIFEGMTDFLSLHVLMGVTQLAGDSIVMHSLSSFQRSCEFIDKKGYKTINTFLDNNASGEKGTRRFQEAYPDRVHPQNDMFANHTDLNDALVANSSS
jgi:hypothetical protein